MMFPKLHFFIHFTVFLALLLAAALVATAQTHAETRTTATVHGHVSDPTGAMIAKAEISITTSAGTTAAP
jgi:hypothetical protein